MPRGRVPRACDASPLAFLMKTGMLVHATVGLG